MNLTILHMTTFLQGGAGRVLCALALYQKNKGGRVCVVTDDSPCPGYENYPEYIDSLYNAGIPVYFLNGIFRRDIGANLRAAAFVRDLLVREAVDIVHANAAVPALTGLIARSGLSRFVPVVLSMQGWGGNKTQDQEAADIATMNLIDAVYPVSHSAAHLLRNKGVLAPGLHVIPNAVEEASTIEVNDDVVCEIRKWHAAGVSVVGCIGTLCARKDQQLLIHALAKLNRSDIGVVFIGDGAIERLRELAGLHGVLRQVRFAGYRANAAAYLRHFDVLVLPSRSEGMPLAILEAFRDRVPVIGSDIPEIAELVSKGETGCLFQAGKVDDLAGVLSDTLAESTFVRQKRCEKAYAVFRDTYINDVMCQRYIKQYLHLLRKQSFSTSSCH